MHNPGRQQFVETARQIWDRYHADATPSEWFLLTLIEHYTQTRQLSIPIIEEALGTYRRDTAWLRTENSRLPTPAEWKEIRLRPYAEA